MFMDAPMVAACLAGAGVPLGAGSVFATAGGVLVRIGSTCGSSVRLFHTWLSPFEQFCL
jgi:hypothetical protein